MVRTQGRCLFSAIQEGCKFEIDPDFDPVEFVIEEFGTNDVSEINLLGARDRRKVIQQAINQSVEGEPDVPLRVNELFEGCAYVFQRLAGVGGANVITYDWEQAEESEYNRAWEFYKSKGGHRCSRVFCRLPPFVEVWEM